MFDNKHKMQILFKLIFNFQILGFFNFLLCSSRSFESSKIRIEHNASLVEIERKTSQFLAIF